MHLSSSRRLSASILALAVLSAACTGSAATEDGTSPAPNGSASPGGSPTPPPANVSGGALAKVACALPKEQLIRIWRGTNPGRSGEILAVPREPDFMDGGISHSGPWDYLQRVPLYLYGPGHIRAQGRVGRPVTVADVAPTQGALVDFPFETPDGSVLREALAPADEPGAPPKLVVVLVWDAAGIGILDRWPRAWPYLKSIIPKGTWYANATVGSSPSVTPPIHATIGTGTFPRHHGLTDNQVRIGQKIMGAWARGSSYMMRPSFADLYDPSTNNEAIVGQVSTLSWHLGMIGHGSMWTGGDPDIAVLRISSEDDGAEGVTWSLGRQLEPSFEFPSYVNDVPGFEDDKRAVDQADGALDGRWREKSIEEQKGGFHTPARIPYQTRIIEEVVKREGFGADDVPDLLYLNYKLIDEVGHESTGSSVYMEDSLKIQDEYLDVLIRFLDRQVGKGEWAMILTADHGHTLSPDETGAFRISIRALEARLAEAFGEGVVERVRPSNIYVNHEALEAGGYTVGQVAAFLNGLTKAQTARDPASVDPEVADEPAFAAVFPSSILGRLPCLPEARQEGTDASAAAADAAGEQPATDPNP